MRRSEDFRRTTRSGVRVARPTLVVHAGSAADPADRRIGFVVGKSVGNAVVRNRCRRRLRHLAAARIDAYAGGGLCGAASATARGHDPTAVPSDLAVRVAEGPGPIVRSDESRPAMKYLLIGLLKLYRLVISPLYGNVCRYYPSCSAYALRAVTVHGAVKGSLARGSSAGALPPLGRGWVRSRTRHPGIRRGDAGSDGWSRQWIIGTKTLCRQTTLTWRHDKV